MNVRILHWKRALCSVLFTLLLSVPGVTNATAQTFTVGDLNYSINDDGASVTLVGHVDGISGELVIPESVEIYGTSYPVTVIGSYAFSGCTGLTGTLVIPNSVIVIGNHAFEYCFNFTGLTLGNAVQDIIHNAFINCYGFTDTLTIPESVTYIGSGVFWDCSGFTTLNYNATNCSVSYDWTVYTDFTTLNIGENVQTIPSGFLYNRTSFTGELVIPESVISIGNDAFYGCSGFTGTLTIPEAVTYIGSSAFDGCSGFTGSLTIPNSVTTISNSAFNDCTGLSGALVIPEAVTSIGESAFHDCAGFAGSLNIPDNVTTIGGSAFMGCTGFSGVLTLGQSLAEIGNNAFFGACENFTSFNVLAETPPTLGTNVFLSVNTEIPVYVTCGTSEAYQNATGWISFANIQETNPCQWEITATANPSVGGTVSGGGIFVQGTSCTLTATAIGDFEFASWTENGAVVSTDAVYTFTVESNRDLVANFTNPNFIIFADPNVEARCVALWDSDGDGFLSYDEAAAVTSLGCAFEYWGITSFDELQYFTGLTYLNDYEFYGCGNLTSITLPENITYIYYAAFAECYNLNSITVLANMPPQIDDSWAVFYGIDRSIPVAVPCGTTSSYQNAYGWNEFYNYQEPGYCIYEITATVNNEEAGTVSGDVGFYQRGQTCTLVATPNEGWGFYYWMENGMMVSTNAEYSFVVTSSRDLMAVFGTNAFGILGNTTYDWQSNKGAITRTIVWPDGKVNFAFTQATEASFSDRGTGIGTYDAANEEWIPSYGRVENEKTGFGSIARYGQNGIVVASHTGYDSRVYIIEDRDNIEPNSVPMTSILDNTYNIEWPNVMTSGPNRNIIHVVATPYDSYTSIPGMENVYQPILYFRSQDGGQTWDKQNVVLPFMTAEYGLSWGSNCCYWMETTEDNCLALVVNNPWSDGMVIYSYDNGETWERKVFYKHPDPFSYHDDILVFPRWTSCQWDSDHNLHVLYEFNGTTGDPGSGSYYPSFGGIAYWNETMPYNVAGTTQSAIAGNLIPGQPFVMDNDYLYNDILSSSWWWSGATHEMWPEYIGYLPTLDDNGNWEDPYQAASFNIEDRSRHGSYNSGVCSFPVLCNVPGTNDMVAVWCAMDENNTDENGNYYYKIFASYSVGGYQWTNMMQLTNDVMFQHTECTYLQAVVVGDRLVIASQMDGQTGTYVQSDDYDPYDNHYIGLTFDLTELFGVVPGNSFYIATSTNFAVGGTVSGAGIYELGQTCTLTATPNEEFEFVNWTENGEVVSTDETYSFAVTGHRNLVANFHLVNVNAIVFADPNVEAICVANWDVDSDGALCYSEAALVSDLGWKFSYNTDITSFDELQYFTKVVSINDDAFRNCIGLTSIILPEHVTFIGSDAFRNCCGLRGEITLPESLESVGEYAFYGCDGISTVNYNAINCQTMGSVEYPVFYDCAFTHLNIGENVQSIPNFAFRRCFMITDMTVAAVNPPTISSGTFGMVSRSIPVSVPHGSGDAYSNAPYWEEFFNIIEVYFNDVQTVPLAAGWNWFSSNLDITLDDLKSALVEALPGTAITIKSRSQNTAYNPSTNRWRGTLNSLDVTQMYMISVGTGGEITLSGTPIDPAEHPITINNGTNWIAFPLSENMTVSNAFAGFAVNGDKVKSRNGNSQYIRNRWSGGVTTLVPGQGYMYISTTQEPRVLTFPASAK